MYIINTYEYCHSSVAVVIAFVLLIVPRLCYGSSLDAITPDKPLKDGDILFSPRKTFALGFFSPNGNPTRRYVGIWYQTIPGQTVVWVANRDNPIFNTSGVLAVDSHGGLKLYSAGSDKKSAVWSANVSTPSSNSFAKLSDVGNFAVFRNGESIIIWQSFDHPTDTMLPFMTLGLNRRTGLDRFLTSWKSPDDPGTGNCTLRIKAGSTGRPQLYLEKAGSVVWQGGPWTGLRWSGVPAMTPNFIFNISYVETLDEVSITYGILNQSILSRMAVDGSGKVYRATWHGQIGWKEFWKAPEDSCDAYRLCGANGYCDSSEADRFECECLPGFEPREPRDWALREGSGGCVRKRAVGCGAGDGFVGLARAKLPDTSVARVIGIGLMGRSGIMRMEDCERECRRNCSCTAYAAANESAGGSGCVLWYGDLVDTRVFPTVGQDLYVRVDAVTLGEFAKQSKRSMSMVVKLVIGLSSGVVLFSLLFFMVWCAKKVKKERESKKRFYSISANTTPAFSQDFAGNKELGESSTKSDLPIFTLNTIASATDNFSLENKLGEGGFGSVYKGMLSDGKEIAVKRLSKYSGQGTEEFKNEVMLIANLQHRSLVRIIGCCVHGEEKMLIYEYLPNKSLDLFIFDDAKRKLLDWRKRFDIICGVARGLLYLHQDSRLRIIHRDLKTSNVLLDADMNPKIADFGMARIFGGDQNEANTNRVVGTYGYMSPEYAMEGRFSTKSDVYSFGVLLLEIITGKKNTSFFPENPDSNLVGYVWEMWKEGKALELVDSSMDGSFAGEALKCIQIGLLCVQDYANDRPSMSTVVFMLGNNVSVPTPKQPAFMFKRSCPSRDISTSDGANSINDVTCSIVEPR